MKKYYFGNFIYKNSFIHNINPTIKLIVLAIFMTLSSLQLSNIKIAILFLVLCLIIILSKIKIKEFYGSIRTFRFLILFALFMQIFFSVDGSFSLIPSKDTLHQGFYNVVSFIFIISFSAIFTLTTSPSNIVKSLYFFIKPLQIVGVNTKDMAISMIVAIRFIPILFEEANRIIVSQKLRGLLDTDKGFFKKIKIYSKVDTFIIPLFMRVIYYANQLSITLMYRHNVDKIMKMQKLKIVDVVFIIFAFILGWVIYVV